MALFLTPLQTRDVSEFGRKMLLASRGQARAFLSPESVQVLFTPQSTRDGRSTGYGLGWSVDKEGVSHSGAAMGASSHLLITIPAANGPSVVVASATNLGGVSLRSLNQDVAKIWS